MGEEEGRSKYKELSIYLPREHVEVLEIISKQFSMSVSQFIAYLFERYKYFWEKGREYEFKSKPLLAIDNIIEDFGRYLKEKERTEKYIDTAKFLAKEFVLWWLSTVHFCNIEGDKEIELFLNRYREKFNITDRSYLVYMNLLRHFIYFIRERCQKESNKNP